MTCIKNGKKADKILQQCVILPRFICKEIKCLINKMNSSINVQNIKYNEKDKVNSFNPIALRKGQNSMEFWPFLSVKGLSREIDCQFLDNFHYFFHKL